MRNVVEKSCRENQNTHFMFNNFFSENRTVYEIMSKNMVDPEATNDVTIWRIRIACWISKIIRTHAHAHAHAPGHPYTHVRTQLHTQQNIILVAFARHLHAILYLHCRYCLTHNNTHSQYKLHNTAQNNATFIHVQAHFFTSSSFSTLLSSPSLLY